MIFTINVSADNKFKPRGRQKFEARAIYDVVPLNSPVKTSTANFLIKTPAKFDIDEVQYMILNANLRFQKKSKFAKIEVVNGAKGKEIRVPVSNLSPGFYQLFVKVIDKKKTHHDFHDKFLDHARFVIDQTLEVKMPDPKVNDATVAGVDSDNDGIRDDIQRWINENYSNDLKTKLATKQIAVKEQQRLLTVDDKEKSIQAVRDNLYAMDCVVYVKGLKFFEEFDQNFKIKFLNTKERHLASIKASSNFSGESSSLPNNDEEAKSTCEFNVDSI